MHASTKLCARVCSLALRSYHLPSGLLHPASTDVKARGPPSPGAGAATEWPAAVHPVNTLRSPQSATTAGRAAVASKQDSTAAVAHPPKSTSQCGWGVLIRDLSRIVMILFDLSQITFGFRGSFCSCWIHPCSYFLRFTRPILHDLCTPGFAARAVIKSFCNGDPAAVQNIFGRFLLHVYPGETLVTEMWVDGQRVQYQTKVKERDRAVLSRYMLLKQHIPSSL
ncbi:Peroxisomal multifunctional enzyme type 2 [Hordeum vulgare]|nr:Peroxisomal multifunctional enzyme type 2 [Hordeum vulgare]